MVFYASDLQQLPNCWAWHSLANLRNGPYSLPQSCGSDGRPWTRSMPKTITCFANLWHIQHIQHTQLSKNSFQKIHRSSTDHAQIIQYPVVSLLTWSRVGVSFSPQGLDQTCAGSKFPTERMTMPTSSPEHIEYVKYMESTDFHWLSVTFSAVSIGQCGCCENQHPHRDSMGKADLYGLLLNVPCLSKSKCNILQHAHATKCYAMLRLFSKDETPVKLAVAILPLSSRCCTPAEAQFCHTKSHPPAECHILHPIPHPSRGQRRWRLAAGPCLPFKSLQSWFTCCNALAA